MVQRLAIFFLMLSIAQTAMGMGRAILRKPRIKLARPATPSLSIEEKLNAKAVLQDQTHDQITGYVYELCVRHLCPGCNKSALVVPCTQCAQKLLKAALQVIPARECSTIEAQADQLLYQAQDVISKKKGQSPIRVKKPAALDSLSNNSAHELIRIVQGNNPLINLKTISIFFHSRACTLQCYKAHIEHNKNLQESEKVRQEMERLMQEPVVQTTKSSCCCVIQ